MKGNHLHFHKKKKGDAEATKPTNQPNRFRLRNRPTPAVERRAEPPGGRVAVEREKARNFIGQARERKKKKQRQTTAEGQSGTHRITGAPVGVLVSEAEPPCCVVVQPLHAHVRAGYGGAARSRPAPERAYQARRILSPSLADGWLRSAKDELAKKREGESSWAGGRAREKGREKGRLAMESWEEKASRNPSVWEQCSAMGVGG